MKLYKGFYGKGWEVFFLDYEDGQVAVIQAASWVNVAFVKRSYANFIKRPLTMEMLSEINQFTFVAEWKEDVTEMLTDLKE